MSCSAFCFLRAAMHIISAHTPTYTQTCAHHKYTHTHPHTHAHPHVHTGIPSPPVNVTVENRTCNCLHVTWTTPLYDGHAPLLYTQLQFNDTSNSSAPLRNLRTQSGGVKSVEVCDLVPNVLYLGSVWAVNRVGVSAGVEVELLITAKGEN